MYLHGVGFKNGKFYPYATMDTDLKKLKITDEIIADWKKKNILIRYNGEHYTFDYNCNEFKENDVVLDRKDATCGIIEMLKDGKCAVNDNGTAELGVPVARLIKMKPILSSKLKKINVTSGVFDID